VFLVHGLMGRCSTMSASTAVALLSWVRCLTYARAPPCTAVVDGPHPYPSHRTFRADLGDALPR